MLKQKTYNTEVVLNGEMKLLLKGNFKRSTMCDELDKIRLKKLQT